MSAAPTLPTGRTGDERRARMAWARIAEPDDKLARQIIAVYGLVDGLDIARRGSAAGITGLSDRFQARLDTLDVNRDLVIADRVGARVLVPGDPEWPLVVDGLEMPPWALWVQGPLDLQEVTQRSVAVVGARACTAYGSSATSEIAAGMADRGFAVVSGGAFGIDAAAHRAALAVDGATVSVLACGVDRSYPAAHTQLLDHIRRCGAVVSEMPPGSAPMRTRFLARNRVIAALGAGTVLVEAGLRSGARSTVSATLDLNRPVGAVPGPVTSMVSAGCHEEIRRERATLVTDAAEVADLVGGIGADLAPDKRGPELPRDGLDGVAQRVWQSLPGPRMSAMSVDALTRVAGLGAAETIGALGRLDVAGQAQRKGHGWVRR
ncbi:MAG: DNA-processing protein DprA [Ornithinimicrobium sp.]|uniref:DNA-processing protein DprA n=1 Tax=Ornithinimicrobium sp. TaxID=1977084 RepID=UPI003D9BCF97